MRRVHAVLGILLAVGMLAGGAGLAGAGSDGAQTTLAHPDHSADNQSQLECGYPLEVTDATGTAVELTEEPDEVVTLGASDAQTVWELGAQETVTGLPVFPATAYLPDRNVTAGGQERTDVADEFGTPVPEEVVGLDPDLVLAASIISEETVGTLREANLTVYSASNEESLADVYTTIERIGQLLNRCDEAEQTVADMQSVVSEIDAATEGEDTPGVYYAQVPGQGFTAGAGTVEDDIISVAGGRNIAAEAGVEFYGQLTEEEIVAEDPDWMIVGAGQQPPESLSTTTAVQEDQIIEVNPNAISQPGPRMVEPVQTIAEALHPEALAQDDNETDDRNETDGNETDADGSGPGLTAVAALVALGVVVATRRRQA